jgi:hypothetical protein
VHPAGRPQEQRMCVSGESWGVASLTLINLAPLAPIFQVQSKGLGWLWQSWWEYCLLPTDDGRQVCQRRYGGAWDQAEKNGLIGSGVYVFTGERTFVIARWVTSLTYLPTVRSNITIFCYCCIFDICPSCPKVS